MISPISIYLFFFIVLSPSVTHNNLTYESISSTGLTSNPIFLGVIVLTTVLQYLIVTFGGEFTRTSPLTADQWVETVAFGLISLPVGFIMRFVPVVESEDSFFSEEMSMDSTRGST